MKKMFLVMLSLLVVAMFLVGCAQEKVSDEELEAELSELSAGELDEAIETVEAQDTGALAGQAYMKRIPKIPRNIPKEKFLKTAYKVKSLKLIEPPCPANYIYLAQDNYLIQVNSPPYGQCGFASASDYYACGASFIPENACSEGFALKPLGVAYKKDISDTRESPSINIIENLHSKGVNVSYYDPFVDSLKLNAPIKKEKDIKNFNNYDLILLHTAHTEFSKINFEEIDVPLFDATGTVTNSERI